MQNSMYYTTSGLTSLPEYQGGGYLDQYGRQQYGLGKLVKSITRPVAKILDKIVPNEIKPALPFVAAAVPFMLGPTFSFGGLPFEVSRAIAAAGANAASQLSQEGAAERGLNPISLGLSAAGGYLSTPGVSDTLSAGKIVGNLPGGEAITAGELAKYTGVGGYENIAPPTFLQSTENIARNIGSYGAENLSKGTEAFQKLTGPETFTGTDALDLAKAYVPGGLTASGENALVYADLAKKRYEQEMNAMGQLASSNKQQQIDYIRRAMVSAGFTEDEIGSALTRSGFASGGRVAYGLGSLVMKNARSIKNKVLDFLSKMTDDIKIKPQTDYAEDSGASFDLNIYPRTRKGKETLDKLTDQGLVEKSSDGSYFMSDPNLEEGTAALNDYGIKASGVYEPSAKGGDKFESFRSGAGQGPYGADYYGYDVLKGNLYKNPKRPPMTGASDIDTLPEPPEGFAQGGLMNLGGMEMDYRAKGGFVPIGKKERADDVPARLSKNEFVFTARAVRNAGNGDIKKGAKRMYQLMNELEARA